MIRVDRRVGGEEQRDVDVSRPERLEGQGPSGVERHEPLEPQTVGPRHPSQAELALRTFRRTGEAHARRHRSQVADGSEPVARGRPVGHRHDVGVLPRCRRQCEEPAVDEHPG